MSPNDTRIRRNIIRHNSRSLLEQTIRRSSIREVELTWPDHHGHPRGQRLPTASFVGHVLESGIRLSGNVFAPPDTESTAPTLAVPDSATFRRVPWRDHTGHVIADIVTRDRDIVPTTPRSVLRRTVDRLAGLGLSALIRITVEGYILDGNGDPFPHGNGRDSLVEANRFGTLLEPLTSGLGGFVSVSSVSTADGPGQFAITLAEAQPLDAADDVFRLTYALNELARRAGARLSLATPAHPSLPPATTHVQVSVWQDDQPVFGWGAHESSGTAARAADSVHAHLPALTLFGAPSHPSYAQDGASVHPPVPVTWEADPGPIDEEPLHDWPAAARVGLRVAADAEPHWAVAALLTAVVLGLDPEASAPPVQDPPRSLSEAIDATTNDAALTEILGRDAVAAYAARTHARWLDDVTTAGAGTVETGDSTEAWNHHLEEQSG